MCIAISARSSAPNDGTGKGEVQGSPTAYSRSKQNSDAMGMFYQWGRKDPFTFPTSSLHNGGSDDWHYGKYSVKIYNDKSELIYQEDGGRDNKGMTPVGGVIIQSSSASSMMETVEKPNRFYYAGAVISQVEQSKELWDYYWTSYSRGTDGGHNPRKTTWHNTYLDGYIVLRSKSIYDPCPYGYRTPTNGTYNDFNSNTGWTLNSYTGGAIFKNITWIVSTGRRSFLLEENSREFSLWSAQNVSANQGYTTTAYHNTIILTNRTDRVKYLGWSVRCIEDATVKADQSEASASY